MSEHYLPVPWLRAGVGDDPRDGGCVMQVVDWIDTGGWTDEPKCVHPVLRDAAIETNDMLSDEGRQRLIGLIPRLMGTGQGSGYETDVVLNKLLLDTYTDVACEDDDYINVMVAMLHVYDEYTGRTETPKVDFTPVCEVMGRPVPA